MPLYAELILDDIVLNGTRVLTLERLNAVDLVARTSRPATPASFASTISPDAVTVRTFPLVAAAVLAEVSCVNRSQAIPLVPELSSSLAFGEAVPIPTLPVAVILIL